MAFDRSYFRGLKRFAAYRFLAMPRRAVFGGRYVFSSVPAWAKWIFASREESNFTYDLTDGNLLYLAHLLAIVTGADPAEAARYINEVRTDRDLADYLLEHMRNSEFRSVSDNRIGYSRRVGWYALVRLLKPRVVIETGVDKGLGAVVLCAALRRNIAEGHAGKYYGTDIVPTAGWLLKAPYSDVGQILVGDSIESLSALTEEVDLFINDSDHSAEYEAREYETILPKMSARGVILGDNSHVTAKLAEFSLRHRRAFVFFKEQPLRHWYPGGGIGISWDLAHSG
jgi:predicted O-methyltransferase YrrM